MHAVPISQQSPASEKIALFRSLFRGREDVCPRRFESRKAGKSGYAPACAHERVCGICEKLRIKCGDCPHRRFLPVTERLGRSRVERVVADADRQGGAIGVRVPSLDEDDGEPWTVSPSRAPKTVVQGGVPERLELVLANEIYIPREKLTPALRNRILRLAAFQNPEFYRAQAMRLPTYDKPRVIACAEQHPRHISLPRGCLQDLRGLLDGLNIRLLIRDERRVEGGVSGCAGPASPGVQRESRLRR
jgi:hypothetical protein